MYIFSGGGGGGGDDTTAPVPNPMQWASPPAVLTPLTITMVAATATDDGGGPVQYYFEETTGNIGGTSSGWQSSTVYTDTGLLAATQYCYRVRARDQSGNTTGWSSTVCASDLGDTNAPTPAPTIVAGPNNLAGPDINTGSGQFFPAAGNFNWWHKVVANVAGITDDSGGPIEIRFICLNDSSLNSNTKIPAPLRPIYIDTPVAIGSIASGWRLTFEGTNVVYDVDIAKFGGIGKTLNWKVCVYDPSGNAACSAVYTVGPP